MTGILLAGGRSRRMGADKALLDYQGASLLQHGCRILLAVTPEVIVVAQSADSYAGLELPSRVRIVGDATPGLGPLGGIVTGLRAAGPGVHLVAGCDMPRIVPELLRLLLREAEGYDAAVPEIDGRLEPLCASYDARCADEMEARLMRGHLALQPALRGLRLNKVTEPRVRSVDPDLVSFTNINTPDDYRLSF